MRRPIHVPLYVLIVLVFTTVATPILAITASVTIANRATERHLDQMRHVSCTEYDAVLDALSGSQAPVIVALVAKYRELYAIQHCPPR